MNQEPAMDAVTDIPISLKDPIDFLHATGNTYILHTTYEYTSTNIAKNNNTKIPNFGIFLPNN